MQKRGDNFRGYDLNHKINSQELFDISNDTDDVLMYNTPRGPQVISILGSREKPRNQNTGLDHQASEHS